MNNLQHPDITAIERTGYPKPERRPHCPVCGAECYAVIEDRYGDIVGCNYCTTTNDAWERGECFPLEY